MSPAGWHDCNPGPVLWVNTVHLHVPSSDSLGPPTRNRRRLSGHNENSSWGESRQIGKRGRARLRPASSASSSRPSNKQSIKQNNHLYQRSKQSILDLLSPTKFILSHRYCTCIKTQGYTFSHDLPPLVESDTHHSRTTSQVTHAPYTLHTKPLHPQ